MTFHALSELAAVNGYGFSRAGVPAGSGPVCIVAGGCAGDDIVAAAEAGRDVLVFVDAATRVQGRVGSYVSGAIVVPSATDPIAAATWVTSASGARLHRPCAVTLDHTIDHADGQSVAGRSSVGKGTLTVVGSVRAFDDLHLYKAAGLLAALGWDVDGVAAWSAADTSLHTPAGVESGSWSFDDGGRDIVDEATWALRTMDPQVWAALRKFRHNGTGALVLRNIPVGKVGATPPYPTAPADKDRMSEIALCAVALALGEPVGYLPEHGGDIIQNILPVKAAADRQISTSSKVELKFHTEAAFHPHKPRFLLLLCLRGDADAGTTLATIDDVCARLTRKEIDVLSQPRFRTRADESYTGTRSDNTGRLMAVLDTTGRPSMCFDEDVMEAVDDEAADALRRLAEVVVTARQVVTLERGDLLVVDNRTAVHGRTPFTPRFDGTDRWLQRSFVISDLADVEDLDGRVIATRFL